MPLMARMMGRAMLRPQPRFISQTVIVYNTKAKPKVEEKSVEQLKEEKQLKRDLEARKLSDALNTDYFD